LKRAGQQLDKAGYSQHDGSGRRLGSDGKPIVITFLTQSRYPQMVDALELMKPTWAKVGVELRIDNVSPELVGTRLEANKYDATVDSGELGWVGSLTDPRWFFATGGSSYAPLWSNWYEGGTPKEDPPKAMQRQAQIYRERVVGTSSQETQYAAMREIIQIARDEFWTMGVSRPAKSYAIVTDRIHNVPGDDKMWLAFKCPYPAVTNVSQYYIEGS
jgi:peptide/nickel transport system substrate-binding protein